MSEGVRNNTALNRFELRSRRQVAVAYYRIDARVITFVHTRVPQALSVEGSRRNWIRGALEMVRAQGLEVVPQCPFVSAFMGKHPEYQRPAAIAPPYGVALLREPRQLGRRLAGEAEPLQRQARRAHSRCRARPSPAAPAHPWSASRPRRGGRARPWARGHSRYPRGCSDGRAAAAP